MTTARRFFEEVSTGDWVVLYLDQYLDQGQVIALAQIDGDVRSNDDHPLNTQAGEIFKYRKLRIKKTFALADLPDAYRLVPTQGRANVHGFSLMYEHVKLLAEHSTADEVVGELAGMPFDRLLDRMGASAWESFCFCWLIMEQSFIPTGLSTGRTLKAVDLVGRNKVNGRRIIAQCKKDPNPVSIKDFVPTAEDEAYYFAFGGCKPPIPSRIQVINGADALRWAETTENGRLFQRLFLGRPLSADR